MKISDAQKAFYSRCFAQNLSMLTMDWYTRRLKLFAQFLTPKNIDEIGAVTPVHIREYFSFLRQKGQSPETTFRTWGALRCFFHFLHMENIIGENPMERIEKPLRERRIIQPMNMAQVRALIAQPDIKTPQGLRNRALMLLMADSGLRLSEAIYLKTDKIDWKDCLVTIMGKGRKERSVPIGETTKSAMAAYARVRQRTDLPFFFLSRGGRPMNNRYVQVAMRKYGGKAGITGVRVSPHTLRHTFAIEYVKNGGDVFSLQAILGHSTLEMVMNYVHLASHDIMIQHRKFSPIDFR